MTVLEAIRERHSVRSYLDRAIEAEKRDALNFEIAKCNAEGNLSIRLITDEPRAFAGLIARYGRFENVKNYIALAGKDGRDLSERVGYYGERLVLLAQTLGLNTCWVAGSHSKSEARKHSGLKDGEKLIAVISIGYGKTQGKPRKSKPLHALYTAESEPPEWFLSGVEAAMLAPTAINQQRFLISLKDGKVTIKDKGGFYSKIDLGIVKYHFEIATRRPL
ncbi:MAG: nitroreductase family protein [Clostridia bacterium]|nr:nitroreductase family protein [Clostridia bacterium]